jgi:hypothetical protein
MRAQKKSKEMTGTYSGLKNHCNVWGFWKTCDVAPDSIEIMLSVSEVE